MKKIYLTLLALFCAGSAFAFPDGGYNEGDAKIQGSLTVADPNADYPVIVEDGYIKLGDGWVQYSESSSELQFSNNAGVDWAAFGSGGTGGGSTVKVDGTTLSTANFIDTTDITVTATGSNVGMALASGVASNIGLGVTAHGWGNHGNAGYLTAEADTLQTVTTRGLSTTTGATFAGNVGIGTTDVTAPLTVNGTVVAEGVKAYGSSSGVLLKNKDGTTVASFGVGSTSSTNIALAGNTNVTGTVTATAFAGNGSGLTGISAGAWTVSGTDQYSSNSGNIGIGSTAPTSALDVVGGVGISDALSVVGNANIGSGDFVVDATSGNVGINSATPARKLDVVGTGRFSSSVSTGALTAGGTLTVNAATADTALSISQTATGATKYLIYGRGAASNGTYLDLRNDSNYGLNAYLGSSGSSTLNGANSLYWVASGGGYIRLVKHGGGATNTYQAWVDNSAGTLSLAIAGSPKLTVSGSNVGVGTISPSQLFHVAGVSYFSGNVGVGSKTPAQKLDVNGAIKASDFMASTGNIGMTGSCADGTSLVIENGLIISCS